MPRKRGSGEVSAAAALMGSKGGKAKAAKLTATQRKEIGKQLADARKKKIPPEERSRIAKAAVAKREEYRRHRTGG